jgi:hypothetical protein
MKRSAQVVRCMSVVAACVALGGAAAAQSPEASSLESRSFALASDGQDLSLPPGAWNGRVIGIPGPEKAERRGAAGLPTFTASIIVEGVSYPFTMVGSDPRGARPRPITVPLQIIPVRVVFNDGVVLDPKLPGPACAGPGTPLANTLQSPLFKNVDYGEGGRQYVEENRRVEFWSLVGAKSGYSVRVAPSVLPSITITYDGPSLPAPCGRVGVLPLEELDALIQTRFLPGLRRQVSARTFPLFLFTNVVTKGLDSKPNSFILGYHSAIGAQTYGVAEYDTDRMFENVLDIAPLSHEIAEWYDDPFVNNATPSWGHIGQASGCQYNLEVGDPLSGHLFSVTMPNGMTYHPQELAFFSWFFGQVPSLGLEGLYSWGGTLTSPAAPCH